MVRRATWQTLPGDPQTRLGWVLSEWPRWRENLTTRGTVGLVLFAIWSAFHGDWVTFVLANVVFFGADRFCRERKPEYPAVDEPAPERILVGMVTILRDGVRLGTDQVVVSFVDGWLHVEGRRTTFSLRTRDVTSLTEESYIDVLRLQDGIELRFDVSYHRTEEERERLKQVRVSLAPTSTYFCDWYGGEIPAGESILPPECLHVSSFARPNVEFAMGLFGLGTTLVLFRLFGLGWGTASLLLLPGPLQLRTAKELVARRRFEASHRSGELLAPVSVADPDSIRIGAGGRLPRRRPE